MKNPEKEKPCGRIYLPVCQTGRKQLKPQVATHSYIERLQRFQVVVKSHPLGKTSSPLFNSVLLPSPFGCLHTLHFSNITILDSKQVTHYIMTKSSDVKECSRKTERVAMALCIPEKNRTSNVPCTYHMTCIGQKTKLKS